MRYQPMLATIAPPETTLDDASLLYERKYDGMRITVEMGKVPTLYSRDGVVKNFQFPAVVEALRELPLYTVLDGEIVAYKNGRILDFAALQPLINATRFAPRDVQALLVVFDAPQIGKECLIDRPLRIRKQLLDKLQLEGPVQLCDSLPGQVLYECAVAESWEGLMAKRRESTYQPGQRSTDWMKLKLVCRQEFVVGGWTTPSHGRKHFGALLLGAYANGKLTYAGSVGSGFTDRALWTLGGQLRKYARASCPFSQVPNERGCHWCQPIMVVEVKFNEWTSAGKLRHPVFLGIRTDKHATEVTINA